MNALFEIFGEHVKLPKKNNGRLMYTKEEILELAANYREARPENLYYVLDYFIMVIPDFKNLAERINKEIDWLYIESDFGRFEIHSTRTIEDIQKVIDALKKIEYDNGYGHQYITDGVIMYKNGTWLERCEYDGQEWWNAKSTPKEPDWDKE